MYLLGPHGVYLVQVVAGCVWVLEGRIWAPDVYPRRRDTLLSG